MRVLLCRPTHFDVLEEDPQNRFMDPEKDRPNRKQARIQFENLKLFYEAIGVEVFFVKAKKDLPDMTFTANAGFAFEKDGEKAVILSNFTPKRRRGERMWFRRFFEGKGYQILKIPQEFFFEGGGDVLSYNNKLLVGYGHRTSEDSIRYVEKFTEREVIPLELSHPGKRGYIPYHLDTVITPLPQQKTFLLWEGALTPESVKRLSKYGNIRTVPEKDFFNLALNGVVISREHIHITPERRDRDARFREILSNIEESVERRGMFLGIVVTSKKENVSPEYRDHLLRERYYPVHFNLDEFKKSGGGAACLTLILP